MELCLLIHLREPVTMCTSGAFQITFAFLHYLILE
jgi:hypothetical protein